MHREASVTQPSENAAASADQFQKWFFRAVQIGGLGVIGHELVQDGQRPWMLLTAGGMMLGSAGLQLIIKWLLRKFGDTVNESAQ